MAFEKMEVDKKYIAVVHGRPLWSETSCDLALVPNGNKRHMTIIDKFRGKKSLTIFKLLGSAGNYSILEVVPKTGRIHQIRVHAAALGFPIVCDPLYSRETPREAPHPVFLSSIKRGWRGDPLDEKPILSRLGLHALEITLPGDRWPGFGTLTAPFSKDIGALISQMEKVIK